MLTNNFSHYNILLYLFPCHYTPNIIITFIIPTSLGLTNHHFVANSLLLKHLITNFPSHWGQWGQTYKPSPSGAKFFFGLRPDLFKSVYPPPPLPKAWWCSSLWDPVIDIGLRIAYFWSTWLWRFISWPWGFIPWHWPWLILGSHIKITIVKVNYEQISTQIQRLRLNAGYIFIQSMHKYNRDSIITNNK